MARQPIGEESDNGLGADVTTFGHDQSKVSNLRDQLAMHPFMLGQLWETLALQQGFFKIKMKDRACKDFIENATEFFGPAHFDHVIEMVNEFEKLLVLGVNISVAEAEPLVPRQEGHEVSNDWYVHPRQTGIIQTAKITLASGDFNGGLRLHQDRRYMERNTNTKSIDASEPFSKF
jgi:hypothetical protein